jgi:hypothetical protein
MPGLIAHSVDEQLGLVQAAQLWLRTRATAPFESVTEATPVRAEWLAETELLVIELFDAGQIRRLFLSGWGRGCRWVIESNGQLQVMPAHLDPGLPLFDVSVDWVRPWRETIPSDVRDILAQFVLGRWALLYWASRYPSALDLLRSEPKLLWLLVMTGEQVGWSEGTIAHYLRIKRRAILRVCGLQSSNAALNRLAKCELSPYGVESLGRLRSLLASFEILHALRHAKSICGATLRFMQQFPALMHARWVQDAADEPGNFAELNQLVADIRQMGQQLHRDDVEDQMLRCRNCAELWRLHDRWVDQLNRDRRQDLNSATALARPRHPREWMPWLGRVLRNRIRQTLQSWSRCFRRYPAPPLAGTATIRPIRTYRALLKEGRSQRHCVAAYHERVMAGHYYVYQVLQPERCTLGLMLTPGQPPRLDQLKGVRNRVVSDATQRTVEDWLNQRRQSAVANRSHAKEVRKPEQPRPIPDAVPRPPIQPLDLLAGGTVGECDMAMVIVDTAQVVDVQNALHVVMHESFQNSLRLALVPEPFAFEGPEKQHLAYLARALIGPRVDAMIRIGGHQLAEALADRWSPAAARALLQDTLTQVTRSITDTITKPGLIGVDFTDIRDILQDKGESFAAVGIATGHRRAERAARQAQAELASHCRFDTARGVLACLTAGMDMAVQEFDEVGNVLRETLSDEAKVVLSTVIQPDLSPEQMLVCIVAAGVEPNQGRRRERHPEFPHET